MYIIGFFFHILIKFIGNRDQKVAAKQKVEAVVRENHGVMRMKK